MFHGKKLVGAQTMALNEEKTLPAGGENKNLLHAVSPNANSMEQNRWRGNFFTHENLLFTAQVFTIKARL